MGRLSNMVKWLMGLGIVVCPFVSHAQILGGQHTEQYNFTDFTPDKKVVTRELDSMGTESIRQDPEFGINPYNTQCVGCAELIDRRTEFSRYFVKNGSHGRAFYVQQSYGALHFKDANNHWRTIDPRLHPTGNPALFTADRQPIHTFFNRSNYAVGLYAEGKQIDYNHTLSMFFVDDNGNKHDMGPINRSNVTAGDNGVQTLNAWQDIDLRQIFDKGGIETIFFINRPLQVPSPNAQLVFRDKFVLPKGCTLQLDSANGRTGMANDLWVGDLLIKDPTGKPLAVIKGSRCYDGEGHGGAGQYRITLSADTVVLDLQIPSVVYNNPHIAYPLLVDPYLSGFDSIGSYYRIVGGTVVSQSATMEFSSTAPGCPHQMTVHIPGKCKLVDAYLGVEYRNNDAALCESTPPDGAFICKFRDVEQTLVTPCSSFTLQCNQNATAPYLGTCTTDSLKVAAARTIHFDTTSNFIYCYAPQCPDYDITFTLYDHSMRCPEVCGLNCAIGTYWGLTIGGLTIEDSASASPNVVCAGSPTTLTNYPRWGVPPYTYLWNTGSTDSVTIDNPESDTPYDCIVTDACGMTADGFTDVTTQPSPAADAGNDTIDICRGTSAYLGGNPTGPAGDAIAWTAIPSYASAWLSSATDPNPFAAPPMDSVGIYAYVVKVSDPLCYRYDTAFVRVHADPHATIQPQSPKICAGQSVTLTTTTPFASYQWSNGASTASIDITDANSYSVQVKDSIGCQGGSDTVSATVANPTTFDITADPDTVINVNDNTMLGASIDLTDPAISVYTWSPSVNISCTDCPEPVVTPTVRQEYYLDVTNADGCTSRDSIWVIVKYPNRYWIVSAFSPNQDGVNDGFYIKKESGVTVKEFKVYNRWGQLVHNALYPWRGMVDGDPAPMGVYAYYFDLQFADGTKKIVKGNVTLIR